jgi:two-component system phosphate regulon sensor histidine kinase PhoR
MTRQQSELPHDFDIWPESAQTAYRSLYERTQAAELIIHSMQATFSNEATGSSLIEQERTPSWRTIMLHTLNDLFRKAATSLDLHDVLITVTRIVAQLLQATSAYVCDWDPQHKTSTVLADFISLSASEAEQVSDVGEIFYLTDDFTFRLTRQVYWVSHFDDVLDDITVQKEFETYDIKTILYIPMVADDHLVGYIEVWETRSKREYTKRQIEFVAALARQIASIVHTAQLHRALKESETRFRLVIQTMREGLVQVDANGTIEFANDSFGKMLECEVKDLIGKSLEKVGNAKQDPRTYETTLEREFSEPLSVHISYAPIISEGGRFLGGVYVYTDVTKRKQAEQNAIDLGVEKERVRILTQFIQDASHEFYTPLSNIGTYAYLLSRQLESEQHQRYLSIIREQTESIRSLISALVVMTKLDSTGALQLKKANMVEVVTGVVNRLNEAITDKRHKLELNLSTDYIPIQCDVDMLMLAIFNLLDNAIRYTPTQGFIAIQLRDKNSTLELAIEDTGYGMSQEVQVQIFRRFYREDTARSTRGFGLGMTIARRIIELHHGEITVESEEGRGTRIKITLPEIEPGNVSRK